jgi:predicted DNA binding CopG/RHH family protein
LALGWFRWREPHLRRLIDDKALDEAHGLAKLPTIRVNVEEAESMKAEAEALGLNLQSYVRYLLAFRPPRR